MLEKYAQLVSVALSKSSMRPLPTNAKHVHQEKLPRDPYLRALTAFKASTKRKENQRPTAVNFVPSAKSLSLLPQYVKPASKESTMTRVMKFWPRANHVHLAQRHPTLSLPAKPVSMGKFTCQRTCTGVNPVRRARPPSMAVQNVSNVRTARLNLTTWPQRTLSMHAETVKQEVPAATR